MNVLLIGCGSIGTRHITNLLACQPLVKFFVMRSTKEHNKFTQSIKATIVKLWDEIDEQIHLVIVANPSSHHMIHIEKIIEFNLPAYLEKPLVTSLQDLNRIKELIKIYHYTQPTMMGCNLRFLPSIILLNQYLEKSTIGKVCRAIFEVGQYLPDWRPTQDYRTSYSAKKELGGGVLFDLVHEIDLVRYLLGEFEVVSCQFDHLSQLEIDVEDTAVIHLAQVEGPYVSIHLDYISRTPTRNIKIVGESGTIIWDLIEQKLILKRSHETLSLTQNPQDFDVKHTYQVAMKELINCINNNSKTSQCISEGIKTTELMLQCKAKR